MKILCLILSLAVAFAACCGVSEDAAVLSIGTDGPDMYADNSPVLDGEYYALVWCAPGRAFAGFTAKGLEVESDSARVICMAPLASGSHCPETTFVVDRAKLEGCSGGTFNLYLLDTRRWDANGAVTLGGTNGVHGSVLVCSTTTVSDFYVKKGVESATFLASALPAGVGDPTITGLRVDGDAIVLTVAGTSANVNYNVAGGESVAADETSAAAEHPVVGSAAAAGQIELRVPRSQFGDRAFFRVVRNPLGVSK